MKVVAIAAALTATAGFAQPIDLKGAYLGDDEAAVLRAMPFLSCGTQAAGRIGDRVCEASESGLQMRDCPMHDSTGRLSPTYWECKDRPKPELTYGSAPLARYQVTLVSDRAIAFTVFFDQRHFGSVAEALTSKIGKPARAENQPVQNRMGATFPSSEITWTRSGTRVTATERFGEIGTSSVLYILDPMPADLAARIGQKTGGTASENAKRL